ncbi:MAG: phage gp6-like head-tail connector protein [Sphingobacteriaceae bacterium]|nr:phage gp6-like head-tail connector protein [Sphingobacteriaceae bacterium]
MIYPKDKPKEPVITYIITEPVAEEVLSLDEVKSFLVVDYDDFDTLLTRLIKAVRINFERWTGIAIGERQIELKGDYESEYAYMPLEPITTQAGANQTVGYTRENCPDDIIIAMQEVIHTCFENRDNSSKYNISDLCQEASKGFRRRVGI